jgi:hypothetical protein
MIRIRLTGILALLLLFSLVSLNAQSLDEILQKNYKARGGYDRIKSKKTVWMSSKMMMGGMELPMVMMSKRPYIMRSEVSLQGQKIISVFDGTSGWMINPMMGSTDPVDLPSEQLKNVREQADVDGLLIDWKEKGSRVELVGKEDVEGADAYHIRITTKDTTVRHIYLDAETFLDIQQKGTYPAQGKEIEVTTSLGGYREVDGLMIPFSMEGKVEGKTFQQVLVDSVKFDVPFADSLFARPAVKK